MALGRTLYNTFFRRTSAFFVTVLVGAVLFERAFDQGGDRLWERMNKGVSRALHGCDHMHTSLGGPVRHSTTAFMCTFL